MPVYLCRWPNGDSSVVLAPCKADAIEALDEAGNAEGCPLVRLPGFMVHFRLTDAGRLTFEGFGEGTLHSILERAYPFLERVHTSDNRKLLRRAVARERERVRRRKAREPQTELGKELKKRSGAATVMVDRIVREGTRRILEKFPVTGKPH